MGAFWFSVVVCLCDAAEKFSKEPYQKWVLFVKRKLSCHKAKSKVFVSIKSLPHRLISRFCIWKQVGQCKGFVAHGQAGGTTQVCKAVSPDCSAAPGSCMLLLIARFSHSPTRSVMTLCNILCAADALLWHPTNLPACGPSVPTGPTRWATPPTCATAPWSTTPCSSPASRWANLSEPLLGCRDQERGKGAGQMGGVCCLVHLSTNLSIFQAYLMAYWAVQVELYSKING